MLANMTVLCRMRHFIIFLAKNIFCKLNPPQHHDNRRRGLADLFVLAGALRKGLTKYPCKGNFEGPKTGALQRSQVRGFMKLSGKGYHKAPKSGALQSP